MEHKEYWILIKNEEQYRTVLPILYTLGACWRDGELGYAWATDVALIVRRNQITWCNPSFSGLKRLPEVTFEEFMALHSEAPQSSEGGQVMSRKLYEVTVVATETTEDGEVNVTKVLVEPHYNIFGSKKAAEDYGLLAASKVEGFDLENYQVLIRTY